MKRCSLKILSVIILGSMMLLSPLKQNTDAFWKKAKDKKEPRVIAVFVDMSGSTNSARRAVYRRAFDKIYQNLQQGDRLMVGTITGQSYLDFKPAVDVEIPQKSIWVDRLRFEQDLDRTKRRIRADVEELLAPKRGAARTEIINSLNIADKIFHNEKRQKVLIILSEMIQDSKDYNFKRAEITDAYAAHIIRDCRNQDRLPNLTAFKVYVAGARASDSQKSRSIEMFWNRYFAAAGADFSLHHYGRSLSGFGKGT
jgi:hypothetical protein